MSRGQCPRGGVLVNVQGCFSNFLRADDVTRTMSKGGGGYVLVKNPVSAPGPPPPPFQKSWIRAWTPSQYKPTNNTHNSSLDQSHIERVATTVIWTPFCVQTDQSVRRRGYIACIVDFIIGLLKVVRKCECRRDF